MKNRTRSVPVNVYRYLLLTGEWQAANETLHRRRDLARRSDDLEYSIESDHLQSIRESIFRELALDTEQSRERWLKENSLLKRHVTEHAKAIALEDIVWDSVAASEIRRRFKQERVRFDRVFLEEALYYSKNAAARARRSDSISAKNLERVTEGESIHQGWCFRQSLPFQLADAAFRGKPGQIIGPLEVSAYQFGLYRVSERSPARLTPEVVEIIRSELAEEIINATDHMTAILT